MTELSPASQKFIVHWGEMGTRWGVNRTVAQIHALLFISEQPLTAEEISATLSVARSTVSTGLRELQSWGIVRVVHILGDRRDHFESIEDVWEMFRIILEGRKRREMDPTVAVLREAIADLDSEGANKNPYAREKLRQMLEFFESMLSIYEQIRVLPMATIMRIAKMRGVISRLSQFTRQ